MKKNLVLCGIALLLALAFVPSTAAQDTPSELWYGAPAPPAVLAESDRILARDEFNALFDTSIVEKAQANPAYIFGYAGADPVDLTTMRKNGIFPNVQLVGWESEQLRSLPWMRDKRGVRGMIVLDTLLFEYDTSATGPCGQWTARLKSDYKQLIDQWARRERRYLKPYYVWSVIPNTEINNRCISSEDLQAAGSYLKQKFPGFPTVVGYGRSPGAHPAPDMVPASIDIVALYKYDSIGQGPSPWQDVSWMVEWRHLLSILFSHQKTIVVPRAFKWTGEQLAKWRLGQGIAYWSWFCADQPSCAGIVPFLWNTVVTPQESLVGLDRMPQSVRDGHACSSGWLLRNQPANRPPCGIEP